MHTIITLETALIRGLIDGHNYRESARMGVTHVAIPDIDMVNEPRTVIILTNPDAWAAQKGTDPRTHR